MKHKLTSLFTLTILVAALLVVTSCDSSETGPVVTRPNPPSSPAQPLILAGNVVDSKSSAGLNGATVEILKTDGSKVTTLTAGSNGSFSYDISNVNAEDLKVTATANGYGFSFVNTKVNLVNKLARAVTVPLDKIEATQVNVSTSGGTATISSTESSQQVSIVFPAGAVTQNTSLQMAQVPVNNAVLPQNANQNAQVGIVNLQPANISFAAPVKLTFPMPYKFLAGDQIPLMELVSGVWQNTGLVAVVDNSGYLASVDISKTGQYALMDNTNISGTVASLSQKDGLKKVSEATEERTSVFSSGTLSVELPGNITFTRNATNVITEAPTDEWIFNNLAQRYGAVFTLASGPGSIPNTVKFSVPWPGAAGNPYKQNADGSGNINRPNESGDWSLKVIFEDFTEGFSNVDLNNPGYWNVNVSGTIRNWREKQRVWVWTVHDQGIVIEY